MRPLRPFLFCTSILLCLHAPIAMAATVSDSSVFQMANGSYYHPATGKMAATKDQLLQLLSGNAVESPSASTTVPTVPAPQAPALRQAVERGQLLLQERINGGLIERLTVSEKQISQTWFPVTLAVWNSGSNQMTLHDVLRKEKQLKQKDGTPVTFASVERSNGVNSTYIMRDPSSIVVANIHPILKQLSNKTSYELVPVVYTPYSDALHTPAMVGWGKTYLQTVIDDVYVSLRQSRAMSRAFPDRLLADVINPEMVRAISVIEHADNYELKQYPVRTVEQVFVTLAANDEDTYAYARSSAGALGLVQFIPSTYAGLRKIRPDLQLTADFETGMRQPKNAVRAQVAYLDLLITEMPEITKASFDANPERVQEYLVAAYNGGSGKVRRAMSDWNGAIQGQQITTLAQLSKRHVALDAQIATLQKKIKATTNKTTIASLKKQLSPLQSEHDRVAADEVFYKKFALREETRTYITKYRQALSTLQHLDRTVQIAVR